MVCTNDDKILVKVLRRDKGYSVKKNLSYFLTSNGSIQHWTNCCGEIHTTGFTERKYGSGRKRTACTGKNIDAVKELVLSKEDAAELIEQCVLL